MLQSMRSQRIGDDWTTEQKHDLTANQKIVLKWHHLFFYAITTNHFSTGLWHVTKSGYYMTTDDDQLSHWMEKKFQNTSQSQSCTKKKKRSQSLFHCLVVCCWSDPLQLLNPGETITSEKYAPQIDKTYWKLQWLQPKLVNRKGPILLHNNAQP